MEKGDDRGMLEWRDQRMCLGEGWNRKVRGLNSGEQFLAKAGSRRRGSCVCYCHLTFSKSRWEATTALRIRVLGENWEELFVLVSAEVSSLSGNSLELYFICSSHRPWFITALVWVASCPWRRRVFPLHWWPEHCGCAGTGTVHFFESFLPVVATKLPSQHCLCSVTSWHTTSSQNGDLKLDSSSCFPQLCFHEQVFPKHSWKMCVSVP